jgi:hypothetical protein
MISCILGSKDRFSKLKVLFKSILEQYNEVGIEPDIIVLDGGSKPEVLKFLEETPGVTLIKESMMHGVTRGYNRGFRIAKYPYVTWLSDDQRLEPGFMKAALEHIKTLADNDFIGISMNNSDGHGFLTYRMVTPVGICSKKMMQRVDFWSEDYITYSSDIDFCQKAIGIGGKLVMCRDIKLMHFMDGHDAVHQSNNLPIDDNRFKKAWNVRPGRYTSSQRIYPNIFVSASSGQELLNKVQVVWRDISWCNIYTNTYFGMDYLSSMNVFVDDESKCQVKV